MTEGRYAQDGMALSGPNHVPVLYGETLFWLRPRPGGLYIDGTVGLGGHAAGLLELSTPGGRVLGLDRDPAALAVARQRLAAYGDRVVLIQGDDAELLALAQRHGFGAVDGVLLDLGVSSLQLDDPRRGFSIRGDGPLDMRMDPGADLTAAEVVNTWPEEELAGVIYRYGEERRSRAVARAICARRPWRSTGELAGEIARVVGRSGRLHPATRTFQALRIVVNDELRSLERALPQAVELLVSGGRLAVICFHSLEDRLTKQYVVRESRGCLCPPGLPQCACGHSARLRLLTRKPLRPSTAELSQNPRSRSARLRVVERLPGGRPGHPAGTACR